MTKVLSIDRRGTLTLPTELRRRLGLNTGGKVVAEETDEGILLHADASVPVEIYSDARLAEFHRNNEQALAGHPFKKKK